MKFITKVFQLGNGYGIYLPKDISEKFDVGDKLEFAVDETQIKQKICYICGEEGKRSHHIIPEFLGGKEEIWTCYQCHGKLHWLYRTKAQEICFKQNPKFFHELTEEFKKQHKGEKSIWNNKTWKYEWVKKEEIKKPEEESKIIPIRE